MSTVGEYFESALIRGIDEGLGRPGLVQAMHGTPRDGSLELMSGTAGGAGPAGDPCPPFRWEGDIKDQAALNALAVKLGPGQAGRAWRVSDGDTLMYWNGKSFDSFVEAFGAMGPDGQPCAVSIGTVNTGPAGSDLQVTVTGTPPNLVLNLTVPQGIKGRKGEPGGPGPIRSAADYTDGAHNDRTVPAWSSATSKWVPRPHPGLRGPWSIVDGQAWDGGPGFVPSQSNISAATITVAQLKVPAQDVDWRPHISGGVMASTTESIGIWDTRVDAEVHIGAPDGQIVAMSSGFVFGLDSAGSFQPHFATSAMTPDSTVGVVPAGQAVTLYVVLSRNRGNSNYNFTRTGSQIICWARPVPPR
ncbi:hypothetical protein [Nocardia sp. NPDC020380]|uniref:hypothetical protein n=1 Tax=Nocardia sp. NPDC020380 TaxID=3364309 RepID=UPI0037B70F13